MICESFFEWKSHSAETYTGRKRRWEITELRSWRHWHFYTAWNIRRLYCFRPFKMEKIRNVSPNRYKKQKSQVDNTCVSMFHHIDIRNRKKACVRQFEETLNKFWKKYFTRGKQTTDSLKTLLFIPEKNWQISECLYDDQRKKQLTRCALRALLGWGNVKIFRAKRLSSTHNSDEDIEKLFHKIGKALNSSQ